VDVCLPLPTRRVRMACADVLGLEPLELLLRAELVGLFRKMVLVCTCDIQDRRRTHHFLLCGRKKGLA